MGAHDDSAFQIEIAEDGSVRISGSAAVPILIRLVMAAKFQTDLNAEHLLSPHVNNLLDELTTHTRLTEVDWSNPAILTPPEFQEAAEVVREYRDLHEPERTLEDLLRVALKPYDDFPLERLGLGRTPPGSG